MRAESNLCRELEQELQIQMQRQDQMGGQLQSIQSRIEQNEQEFHQFKGAMTNRDEEHRRMREALHDHLRAICQETQEKVFTTQRTLSAKLDEMKGTCDMLANAIQDLRFVDRELEASYRGSVALPGVTSPATNARVSQGIQGFGA